MPKPMKARKAEQRKKETRMRRLKKPAREGCSVFIRTPVFSSLPDGRRRS
jgi:hypothetical protein